MFLNDSERLEDHFEFTSIWFNIHLFERIYLEFFDASTPQPRFRQIYM